MPLHAGSDGAFWMAVTHVILKEWHHQKQTPYFIDYIKPIHLIVPFLIRLDKNGDNFIPGKLVRANEMDAYKDLDNGDWKFLNFDSKTGKVVVPKGSAGHRWDQNGGQWNMKLEHSADDSPYDPQLTLLEDHDEVLQVAFTDFGMSKEAVRGVPVKYLETAEGKIPVATIYDVIMGQYGVDRDLEGDYPKDYSDKDAAYTPAWQEIFTGVDANTVLQFAREWANTADLTKGKCMIIVGAGINHWYHANLMYRSGIMALMLCGCVGKNGGGMNHYVGQEKLAPMDSWGAIAFGKDWQGAVRLQQAPIWHYINTCQYRYDGQFSVYNTVPDNKWTRQHTADTIFQAVRMGWMPFYPQFNEKFTKALSRSTGSGGQN